MLCTTGFVALAAVVLVLGADPAEAKKPPAPPPPSEPLTEGIYFRADAWYVMSSDGSRKDGLLVGGIPSRQLHGGQRWFLRLSKVGDETHPDGTPHRELFALSEDGDEDKLVQLTSDASVQFSRMLLLLDWAPGDQAVTFVAHRWDQGQPTQAGIYKLAITYDDDGNVEGSLGDPVRVVASSTTELESGEVIVNAERGFAWSPDGTKIVYGCWGANYAEEVRITPVASPNTSTLLATGADHPDWSVNDVISYGTGLAIKLVNPDGTGTETLLDAGSKTNIGWPRFSPDGNSIVYIVLSYEGKWLPVYSYGIYVTSVGKPRAKDLDTTIRGDGPLTWR